MYSPTASSPSSSTSWLRAVDRLPKAICNKLLPNVTDSIRKKYVCTFISLAMLALALLSLLYILHRTQWNRTVAVYTGLVGRQELVDEPLVEKVHNRAKFLVRESARLVASALEKRGGNLLEAYEDAAHAAVLARTAKEIEPDVSQLSKDLGIDFYQYLSYTSTVLQELRSKLRHS